MRRHGRILSRILPVTLLLPLLLGHKWGERELGSAWWQEWAAGWSEGLYGMMIPAFSWSEQGHTTFWALQDSVNFMMPLYSYITQREGGNQTVQAGEDVEGSMKKMHILSMPEDEEERLEACAQTISDTKEPKVQDAFWEGIRKEAVFTPHQQQIWLETDRLSETDTLLDTFYTIDPGTSINGTGLSAEAFLQRDFTISKEGEGPQILIFHTHSREAFADSVEGDWETSIVGVGEHLAEILRNDYGYKVLHHTESYDAESRDNAYSKALVGVERILQEHPQIEVVIDLHRDEVKEGTRLAMDLDGRPTARFMFFNGLSRTKKNGDISYLYNENRSGNLAFSFQMQLQAAQYYPGLTRKIYLKSYRYNMHLRERYLLIELGAQNNTVAEAMNACDPLAHILDLVLDN